MLSKVAVSAIVVSVQPMEDAMAVRQPGLDKLKAQLKVLRILEKQRPLTSTEENVKRGIMDELSLAADYES